MRASATTGLLACGATAYTPVVAALFVEAMDVPDPSPDQFPFTDGKLDALVYGSVLAHGGGQAEVEELRRAALERGTAAAATWSRLAAAMLATGFKPAVFATRADFTPEQLATQERLSRRETAAPFHHVGVPTTLSTRRRWLALDPPGPLDLGAADPRHLRGLRAPRRTASARPTDRCARARAARGRRTWRRGAARPHATARSASWPRR